MIISKHVLCQSVIQIFAISLCLLNLNGARSECGSTEWECDDGQCINDDFLCNGRVDCNDRSDEIAENCIHFHETCQSYAFNCSYGACIDGRLKCNGDQDCADNSDELICEQKDDSDFQGTCPDTEMQCRSSGECISTVLLCDGVRNCKDGSDESLEVCINYGCFSFGFQCGNGGCISGNLKCDGKIDCDDGSDEAWVLCGTERKRIKTPTPTPTPTPATTTSTTVSPESLGCLIPNTASLQKLQFRLHPNNNTIELGSYAKPFDVVHIGCKNTDKLTGQQSLLCYNGEWNKNFPTCDGYCDGTILKNLSLRAICDIRRNYVTCPEKIEPGTSIRVNCAFGYTHSRKDDQVIRCLPDGSFDKKPDRCEQECGRVAASSTALSKDGIEIDVSMAPWHVAIYAKAGNDYKYTCGGTIISPTIIITAAHCFWDEANNIRKLYTEHQIIAGRSTSNYTTEESAHSRIIKVKEIHMPIDYKGRSKRQKEDIAFLRLEDPLRYSETIAPICLSKDLRATASKYMRSKKMGFINGFGVTNQLERLSMLTLEYYECLDKSPPDAPVADDKFCVYNTDGGMVCRGDSGGGFFTSSLLEDTSEVIYRLWGVISNTPTTKNDCTRTGDQSYVAITNIYNAPTEFTERLRIAREQDEELF